VNGLQLAIFRSGGKFYATAEHCTHEDESLEEGWLDGCQIECPRHGAMFDLRTGEAISLPATDPLAVYPVRIDGTDIWVEVPLGADN
jgi:nitrite reductase/ring-hydroxylating ferredoxin subunit